MGSLDYTIPRRKYIGFIENRFPIGVKAMHDFVHLSRHYNSNGGARIGLRWEFNRSGRIDLMDIFIVRDVHGDQHNKAYPIMNTERVQNGDFDWNIRPAIFQPLPVEINLLNRGFSSLNELKQYESILRFGHGLAKDIITKRLTDYDNPINELNLSMLKDDDTAMDIIEKTSFLLPNITDFDFSSLRGNISYPQN
jgi:hypothetical protein